MITGRRRIRLGDLKTKTRQRSPWELTKKMENDNRLPTGEWNGFYLEGVHPKRGWMHLYLSFQDGKIAGEGTDYVGPWTARGAYDVKSGACTWTKQYLGKHSVDYRGLAGTQGIQGEWKISYLSGPFHIWPRSMGYLNEMYLRDELELPSPSLQLGTIPVPQESSLIS